MKKIAAITFLTLSINIWATPISTSIDLKERKIVTLINKAQELKTQKASSEQAYRDILINYQNLKEEIYADQKASNNLDEKAREKYALKFDLLIKNLQIFLNS